MPVRNDSQTTRRLLKREAPSLKSPLWMLAKGMTMKDQRKYKVTIFLAIWQANLIGLAYGNQLGSDEIFFECAIGVR